MWLQGNESEAITQLMIMISINKPETPRNTPQKARETIEKWLEDNDPDNLEYMFEGVMKINADYCDTTCE